MGGVGRRCGAGCKKAEIGGGVFDGGGGGGGAEDEEGWRMTMTRRVDRWEMQRAVAA